MTTNRKEYAKPLPRLQHIEPGQFFTLRNGETHQLLDKCELYGYLEHGKIGLSAELSPTNMIFGDGAGWRTQGKNHEH